MNDGLWHDGWYRFARPLPSPNFGPRPAGADIDLIVLHSISLPPGQYGGDEVQQLFTNRLDWDAHPYFGSIRGLQVSAHFYVRRNGELWQFVSCDDAPACQARPRELQRRFDRHRARRLRGRPLRGCAVRNPGQPVPGAFAAPSDPLRRRPPAHRPRAQGRPGRRLRLAPAARAARLGGRDVSPGHDRALVFFNRRAARDASAPRLARGARVQQPCGFQAQKRPQRPPDGACATVDQRPRGTSAFRPRHAPKNNF